MNSFKTLTRKLLSSSTRTRTSLTAAAVSRKVPPLSPSTPSRTMASKSTTPAVPAPGAANALLELLKARRSYYPLSKELPAGVGPERVQEIVKEALLQVPSSFNSQTNRVVVLFGAEHDRFWDITTEVLKGVVPADSWESTGAKMGMFKGAAGTILFFEDQSVVESFQTKFALYADRFPVWALQSDGMLQHTLWTALEAEGLGANLQHYNPLVDARVAEAWSLPATWKLNAQLVFGGRTAEAQPKTFQPLEERFKVFGA